MSTTNSIWIREGAEKPRNIPSVGICVLKAIRRWHRGVVLHKQAGTQPRLRISHPDGFKHVQHRPVLSIDCSREQKILANGEFQSLAPLPSALQRIRHVALRKARDVPATRRTLPCFAISGIATARSAHCSAARMIGAARKTSTPIHSLSHRFHPWIPILPLHSEKPLFFY